MLKPWPEHHRQAQRYLDLCLDEKFAHAVSFWQHMDPPAKSLARDLWAKHWGDSSLEENFPHNYFGEENA